MSHTVTSELSGLAQHIETLLDHIDGDPRNVKVREIEGLLQRLSATRENLEQWLQAARDDH